MPRVNGIYSLPPIYYAENGTTIMPNQHNTPLEDIANALTQSLPRNGSAAMTGDLNMSGRRVTNLGDGVADSDAATVAQVAAASEGITPTNNRLTALISQLTLWVNRAVPVGRVSWHNGALANIPQGEILASGGLFSRDDYPDLWAWVQLQSPISDTDWLATPARRAKYSTGDGGSNFRVPDLNGAQSGSLQGLFLRGSGKTGTAVGDVLGDAIRNITGEVSRTATSGNFAGDSTIQVGALYVGQGRGAGPTASASGGFGGVALDASRVVPTADENRPVSAVGIFTIQTTPFKFVEPQ